MPSIVEGYEYDIFISYRQNDNKRDGWVTDFVAALKDELDATLKNPVTIYFDENPHDGLLETHQVDASLAKKLKCLVLIPIISQTYCDTKSFAYEHEFLAFNKMAKADELGMNITLANGNVASRVLPVKIHDLDTEDQKILEDELGGPMRSIDFIYKEPGVNRPLKPSDDRNLNIEKTDYHNQINKVANALKEISNGILTISKDTPEITKIEPTPRPKELAKARKKALIYASIVVLSLIFSLYLYINSSNNSVSLNQEKSIAVLPFVNMSNDSEQEYFSDGLSEELLNILAKTDGIQVAGRTSSFSFKGGDKTLKEIGEELGVNYILEGSVRKVGNSMRITAQLIRSHNGFQIWQETYNREYTAENIFKIYDEISNKVLHELQLKLDTKINTASNSLPTESSEAYNYYLKATQLEASRLPKDLEGAIDNYKKAIEMDENFSLAYARLAIAYYLLGFYGNISDEMRMKYLNENIQKALLLDPEEPYVYAAMARYQHDIGNYREAIEASQKAIKLNPNFADAHAKLHDFLYYHGTTEEQKQAQSHLDMALELEPRSAILLNSIARASYNNGNYELALELVNRAIKEAPEVTDSYTLLADIYGNSPFGNLDKAFISLHNAYLKDAENYSLLRSLFYFACDLNMLEYAKSINNKIIELFPENSFHSLNGFTIELLSGNYEAALKYLSNGKSFSEGDKEDNFMFYLDLYSLLDRPEDAVRLTEQYYPEFSGDSIIINDITLYMAFEVSQMYEKAGLGDQALQIRNAFYRYKEVPIGKVTITDTTSWWVLGPYMNRLLMDGDSDELLNMFRNDYFEKNEKSDVYVQRLSISGQSLKNSPNYQPFIDDIDKDIGRMRGEVVSYLKELQMWNNEWQY